MSVDSVSANSESSTNCQLSEILPESTKLLWERGQLVDFTIVVEECRFEVHKVVLAATSGYFQDYLTASGYQKDNVHITGVSATVMDQFIHFIYSNEITLTKQNVADILDGAVHLQIPRAIEACTKFLTDKIGLESWFDARTLFQKYELVNGARVVQKFITRNIYKIFRSDSFSQLLYSDIHGADWPGSEWDLFLCINRWVDDDAAKREESRDSLLEQVRYCLLSPARLSSIKKMEIYEKSYSKWTQFLREADSYHRLPLNLRVLESDNQNDLRHEPTLVLFETDGHNPGGCYYDTYKHTFNNHECFHVPEGSGRWFGEIVINDYLIVCMKVNGEDDQTVQPVQQWYIFNPRTGQWSEMTNLPRDYYRGSLVHPWVRHDCIYAIGGVSSLQDTSSTSSNIDRFDFHTNIWTTIAQLRFAGKDHSAYSLKDQLYVSGGIKNNGPPQDTMDCLTLSTMKWKSKACMLKPRCGHIMRELRIRGEDMLCILDNKYRLECYNPLTNQWSKCVFIYDERLPYKPELTESTTDYSWSIYLMNNDLEESLDEGGPVFFWLYFGDELQVDNALHADVLYFFNTVQHQVTDSKKLRPTIISMSPLDDILDS